MHRLLLIPGFVLIASWCFAQVSPDSARTLIAERAQTVLEVLAKKQIGALAQFVHPEEGLHFSPYGFIGKANRSFKPEEFATLAKNKQKYFWGLYNGSGRPIRRTFQEYFNRFVYDRDYLKSALIAYNVIQRSDLFANIFDIYPDAIVVDYLFLATPEFEEMDWRALRLVFTLYRGEWYLIHIVHDEWTV